MLCERGDFRRQPRRPQHQRLVLLWVLNFWIFEWSQTVVLMKINILPIECCVNVAILDANHVDHNTNHVDHDTND